MKRFFEVLSLVAFVMCSSFYAHAMTGSHLNLGDIISSQVRPDGRYDVICSAGTTETVSALDFRSGNVCPNVPMSQDANIASVQKRVDGKFDVICKDFSREIASNEDILKNKVCQKMGPNVTAPVDILWVVDNSGSMYAYQAKVSEAIGAFVQNFASTSRLDWKMGMISTDQNEKPYIGFTPEDMLTRTTANSADLFKAAIAKLGTNGDNIEKVYTPVLNALRFYPNFVRPHDTLILIVVTDAPEQSPITTDEFLKGLKALQPAPQNTLVYTIIDPSESCPPTDDPFTYKGSRFEELNSALGGLTFAICTYDYAATLEVISQDIISRLKPSLP